MFEGISTTATHLGLLAGAMAVGASWVAAIASPNCSFDKLDGSRADRHVRALLLQTSTPIAGMMLASGAFFLLASSWAAAVTALLAAFGFFSNRWMLTPGKKQKGERTSRKGQRAISVSLSLMFTLVAIVSVVLGMIRI